jgi:hypothetical protein
MHPLDWMPRCLNYLSYLRLQTRYGPFGLHADVIRQHLLVLKFLQTPVSRYCFVSRHIYPLGNMYWHSKLWLWYGHGVEIGKPAILHSFTTPVTIARTLVLPSSG